ncbi:putative ClpP-like protease, partial [Aphelenchoides avenae]
RVLVLPPRAAHSKWQAGLRSIHASAQRAAGIPLVINHDGCVERVYDIHSRLFKDRITCVMTPIDDHSAAAIIAQLFFLQRDSVMPCLGIYDTMEFISAPVATWCIGQVSGMGSLPLPSASANVALDCNLNSEDLLRKNTRRQPRNETGKVHSRDAHVGVE